MNAKKTISLTIPGEPIGKPRMTRRDRWKKRPCVERYWTWCDHVRLTMRALGIIVVPRAYEVHSLSWTAYFAPPPSWPPKRRLAALGEQHRQKPDRDNIDKAVLDCLFPDNDAAIASGTIEKRWAKESSLEIRIELEDNCKPTEDTRDARPTVRQRDARGTLHQRLQNHRKTT